MLPRAKSRFKFGVYWDEASQAWGACCRAGGQSAQAIELGIFDLEEHAARAYDIARLSMSTNKYVRYYLNYSAGDYEQVGLSEWVYAPKESADDQPLMSTDQFASAIQDSRANDSTNARTSPSKTPSLSTSKSKSPSTHKAPTRKSDSLSSALMRRADRHAAAPATSLQTVHYPKTKWKRREARDAELAKLQAETQRKRPRFSDRLHVEARGGAGGSGCASLWGSSAKGANQPADGGSGGQGGNVIFEANDRVKSLRGVPKLVRADNGKPGGKQNRRGHRGQDRIVQVPVGTVISKHLPCGSAEGEEEDYPIYDWMKNPNEPWIGARDYRSSDEEDAADGGGDARPLRRPAGMEVIADLVEPGERVLVATGGEGGRGNAVMRRKGGNKPASMESEAGVQGETVRLLLELKVLADVGLVGLPNAGKSTLLRAISAARPKVASYAFTTLEPHLGTVQYPGGESIVVADIPGLIAGASKNRGLGHNFLRHIERTRALVFVLDLQRNENPSKLWDQLAMLQDELSLFHGELLERPALIAVNKCDEPLDSGSASFRAMQRLRTLVKLPVVGISAAHGHGIDDLVADLRLLVGNGSGVYAHRDFGDKAEAAAHQGGRKSA
ncbi:hypothetical protein WJX72_003088 [[Myrmecia] bisecta]|uniref:Uncharacterized protein n=1 Tax=[Myrmecia] bisecta TaxID=41462 RepID=A0AAW1PFX5_9CHLO